MRVGQAARGAGAAVVVGLMFAAASCVFPTPPPGDPVPELSLMVSEPEPVAGTVTVTATPENFTPTEVKFRIDTIGGSPFALDAVAPFTASIDTATLANGSHRVWATGIDGTYTVVQFLNVQVQNRPNVVTILLDDLDQRITPYWDALPQSRALIADAGLEFTNAFAPAPVCCPARASILTGDYPHNTGVFDSSPPDGGFEVFAAGGAESDTIATRLQAAGYRNAHVGKYLNGYPSDPQLVPPGWDEWFSLTDEDFYDGYTYQVNHNGTLETYGSAPEDYQTDVLSARSLEFLDSTEADDDQPFFLNVTPSAPHGDIPPAPRHAVNSFSDDALPRLPNFNEADVSDKPTWLREGVDPLTTAGLLYLTLEHRQRMGSLLAVDDLVAGLVARLLANGELQNTLIVFTSDNGYLLGSHRWPSKFAPYEESIRVPLAIRGPGVRVGTETRFATHIDLAPTILDVAGLDPADVDGRSLAPLFASATGSWRDDFLVEFHGTWEDVTVDTYDDVLAAVATGNLVPPPTYRALRTETHLYVEWYAGAVHEYELYDLAADPYELVNLVATPEVALEHAALTATLQTRLEELAACAGPTCRT